MFDVRNRGFLGARRRLVARKTLSKADFRSLARQMGTFPFLARKIGYVAARCASEPETVETRWNGKETRNTAQPGDWIVTSLSPSKEVLRDKAGFQNTYVITAQKFPGLYEPDEGTTEFGPVYRPKSLVEAIYFSGGFEILAPWGEDQRSPKGYLLLNGSDVYGNDVETFETTYAPVR